MKRVAVFGDVHGALDELKELYCMLEHESLDEVRHSGDLIDRGPDSAGVVDFCFMHGIQGVIGNHEGGFIEHHLNKNSPPGSGDKLNTWNQLQTLSNDRLDWLKSLPHLHIDDKVSTVFVHGGVYPGVDWHLQPVQGVCHMALIHPEFPPDRMFCKTKWYGIDKKGVSEDEWRAQGWKRWYELYDHEYTVVFGHATFSDGLLLHSSKLGGMCIGVDTGAHWTGQLTAVILPDLKVIHTKRKRNPSHP